jgi:hypothetical protein
MSNQRAPVLTRTELNRLAFLTSTNVVDDVYQGAVPALLPFLAIDTTTRRGGQRPASPARRSRSGEAAPMRFPTSCRPHVARVR